MEQYAEIIGDDANSDDYCKIATHFENTGDHFKAGTFFLSAKKYEKVHPTITIFSKKISMMYRLCIIFCKALFYVKKKALTWQLKWLQKLSKNF